MIICPKGGCRFKYWIGQKPTDGDLASAHGVGLTGLTWVTDAHQQPDKEQRPTIGLVCPYPSVRVTVKVSRVWILMLMRWFILSSLQYLLEKDLSHVTVKVSFFLSQGFWPAFISVSLSSVFAGGQKGMPKRPLSDQSFFSLVKEWWLRPNSGDAFLDVFCKCVFQALKQAKRNLTTLVYTPHAQWQCWQFCSVWWVCL